MSLFRFKIILFVLAVLTLGCKSRATQSQTSAIADKSHIWPNLPIHTCFEAPDTELESSFSNWRDKIVTAVKNQIEGRTVVRFEGWSLCKEDHEKGIRIRVLPKPNGYKGVSGWTKGLGSQLDGRKDGLNVFTNHNTSAFRYTVLHEFGHALGLDHEHHRIDTYGPDHPCLMLPAGPRHDKESLFQFGPWDKLSIMNYCDHTNIISLSSFDVEVLNRLYGGPASVNFRDVLQELPQFVAHVFKDSGSDYCRYVGTPQTPQFCCQRGSEQGFEVREMCTIINPGRTDLPHYMIPINGSEFDSYCRFVDDKDGTRLRCLQSNGTAFIEKEFESQIMRELGRSDRPRQIGDLTAASEDADLNSPNFCRFIGPDNRIQLICSYIVERNAVVPKFPDVISRPNSIVPLKDRVQSIKSRDFIYCTAEGDRNILKKAALTINKNGERSFNPTEEADSKVCSQAIDYNL